MQCISRYASASGYKLVISRTLGMHGIYYPQPSGALHPRARARDITITYVISFT